MMSMAFSPRAYRAPVLLSLIAALAFPAQGQVARKPAQAPAPATVTTPAPVAVDHGAWLYKGSDITPDAAWQFGTLPNGLRYAVRRNGVPPGQVAVRVRIDAGSLAETDSERGFAHLIEHLSFRGSAYVPDGEAKRVWQRFGATFGSDTNAQTTAVATLYKLDLPSATTDGVDESLKILSGMMEQPAITDAALNAERPVVLAEQREQPGPQVRLSDATNAIFFAGQPLADRSPIGSIKTLQAATAASVKAFHDRWYRPERAVVIVSGDMDPAVAAQLVVKNFAGWKGVGPTPADPDFGVPDPKRPTTGVLVEPGLPPLVAMATVRPWHFNDDTVIFNQKRLVDTLATRLINRRLEQRARAGGSFLQASVSLDDVQRSANVTSVTMVPVGDNWQAALRDVRAVIADAMATAPTQAEVEREYADYDAAMRSDVETARVEAGAKQADDMASALDILRDPQGCARQGHVHGRGGARLHPPHLPGRRHPRPGQHPYARHHRRDQARRRAVAECIWPRRAAVGAGGGDDGAVARARQAGHPRRAGDDPQPRHAAGGVRQRRPAAAPRDHRGAGPRLRARPLGRRLQRAARQPPERRLGRRDRADGKRHRHAQAR
jgi:zinc protease